MFSAQQRKEIGGRLREAREAFGLNQTEFAHRAGLAQHRYNQYEKGERPLTLDAAMRICNEYGLSLDWLFRKDATLIPAGLLRILQEHRSSTAASNP